MFICLFGSQQHPGTFWEKPSEAFPSASEILHQGQLSVLNKDHLVSNTYILTRNQLMKVDGFHIRAVGNIRWVTILPFAEYEKKQVRCGFAVKHSNETIDFYAADKASLDQWLTHLERLSILQDIRNDYTIGEIIGTGGQSIMRLGTSLETGEIVAIKSYEKCNLQVKPKSYKALVNEIAILRELSHPNIVKLYRVYESNVSVNLVMEYIAGMEVSECLKVEEKFSQEDASKLMWNLLDTLQYLEEKKVMHQDIKPENIILTAPKDKSQFKLVDFGFAMKYEGTDVVDGCGSPGYIAPEILMNLKHGPKVDTYSAGILFYTLLSGYSPFSSPTRAETLKKNCHNDISFGSDWLHIDSKLVRIIRVMTNSNPESRMPITDLKDWLLRSSGACPFYRRRASEVAIIPDDDNGLGKDTLDERVASRDANAVLTAAREYLNVVTKDARRGSLPCGPTD